LRSAEAPPALLPTHDGIAPDRAPDPRLGPSGISALQATAIYQTWMQRWHIAERFVTPDWSIVDLWVARALLAQAMPPEQVQTILRLASPQFPRRHTHPEDYLRRTMARAFPFPAQGGSMCAAPHRTPTAAVRANDCSNSTGGR
jgi:hypothetical protein